jgi:hypothetical protein
MRRHHFKQHIEAWFWQGVLREEASSEKFGVMQSTSFSTCGLGRAPAACMFVEDQ